MTKDKINEEYVELCKSRGHLELQTELFKAQIQNINRRVEELRRQHDELSKQDQSSSTLGQNEKAE